MTDDELRDELASEFYPAPMGGDINRTAFKAGWDAARANDRERDELRAEVEKLAEVLYSMSFDRYGYCTNETGKEALARVKAQLGGADE